MADIQNAWHALERKVPEQLLSQLNKPASDYEIEAAEKNFSCKFHEDIVAYLKVHNGCKSNRFLGNRWNGSISPLFVFEELSSWTHSLECSWASNYEEEIKSGEKEEYVEAFKGRATVMVGGVDDYTVVHLNLKTGMLYNEHITDGQMDSGYTLLEFLTYFEVNDYIQFFDENCNHITLKKTKISSKYFEPAENFKLIEVCAKSSISEFLEKNKWDEKDVYPFHVFLKINEAALLQPAFEIAIQDKVSKQILMGSMVRKELGFPVSDDAYIFPADYPNYDFFLQYIRIERENVSAGDIVLFRAPDFKHTNQWAELMALQGRHILVPKKKTEKDRKRETETNENKQKSAGKNGEVEEKEEEKGKKANVKKPAPPKKGGKRNEKKEEEDAEPAVKKTKAKRKATQDIEAEPEAKKGKGEDMPAFEIKSVAKDTTITEFLAKQKKKVKEILFLATKTEKVGSSKTVIVEEKATQSYLIGGKAREKIGLDESDKVTPKSYPLYDIYLQSTSATRKVPAGSTLLLIL